MKALVKTWRSYSIRIGCFLDDGLGASESYISAVADAKLVRSSLINAGFVINEGKSTWIPSHIITWLGITVDLYLTKFYIPDEKILSTLCFINYLLQNLTFVSARSLAQLSGKLIAMKFVMGDVVQLKTRSIYRLIASSSSWDKKLNIKDENQVINELIFWRDNLSSLNYRHFTTYQIPKILVFSDASSKGIAAYFKDNNKLFKSFKSLDKNEASRSSTWRELFAVLYTLKSFCKIFQNQSILWHTDNFAVSLIVKKGSNKEHLQKLALEIYDVIKKT